MTREEAEKYANNMTYRDAINNLMKARSIPYRKATFIKVNKLLKALEQEPCTDAQECYEDLCEYFGDAKDILKSRKDFKAWLERIRWHIHKAEELYEKYEYKQEPCDDAISREAALEKMVDYVASGYADSAEDFEEYSRIITQLPSVNPQPTGHWIKCDILQEFKCSECRMCFRYKTKYCPNCGARMIEPQENNNVNCKTTKCENCTNHNYCDYEPQERSE